MDFFEQNRQGGLINHFSTIAALAEVISGGQSRCGTCRNQGQIGTNYLSNRFFYSAGTRALCANILIDATNFVAFAASFPSLIK